MQQKMGGCNRAATDGSGMLGLLSVVSPTLDWQSALQTFSESRACKPKFLVVGVQEITPRSSM